jgi:hypothetical protein
LRYRVPEEEDGQRSSCVEEEDGRRVTQRRKTTDGVTRRRKTTDGAHAWRKTVARSREEEERPGHALTLTRDGSCVRATLKNNLVWSRRGLMFWLQTTENYYVNVAEVRAVNDSCEISHFALDPSICSKRFLIWSRQGPVHDAGVLARNSRKPLCQCCRGRSCE